LIEEDFIMGKYVVNGATLKCVLGAAPSTLTVLPVNRVQINGKAKANIMDCKPMVNIKPFGTCAKMAPPVPCTPMVAAWLKGKTNVLVGGMPALMSDSMAICACGGGIIKIQKDGQ
jgi:hypothetical protein